MLKLIALELLAVFHLRQKGYSDYYFIVLGTLDKARGEKYVTNNQETNHRDHYTNNNSFIAVKCPSRQLLYYGLTRLFRYSLRRVILRN